MKNQRLSSSFASIAHFGVWALFLGVLMMSLGCDSGETKSSSETESSDSIGDKKPSKGIDPLSADLKLESLSVDEFVAQFHLQAKPQECELAPDFYKNVDPTLHHFEAIEVILADGKRSEIALQNFGAWAIWKNASGNYEMLTTMINDMGELMHLSTYSPEFKPLGSFEVARRSNFKGEESVKRGKFLEGDNYSYTVVTTKGGSTIESLTGLVVVVTSGKYKVMDEVR